MEVTTMLLDTIFAPFVKERPICVMARAVLERLLDAQHIDALFGNRSGSQDLALAILPIHGVPCDHGHASRLTTGTVGTAPT
jgi:hypothetical protein